MNERNFRDYHDCSQHSPHCQCSSDAVCRGGLHGLGDYHTGKLLLGTGFTITPPVLDAVETNTSAAGSRRL